VSGPNALTSVVAPATPPRTRGSEFWVTLAARIGIMSLLNALGVFALVVAVGAGQWGFAAFGLVMLVAADWIYLSRRTVPLKYLFPGVLFLLVFQVYVVLYTVAISFTNYGDGHSIDQETARRQVVAVSEQRVPDSPSYAVTVLSRGEPADEEIAFLVTGPDGDVSLGTPQGLQSVDADDVTRDDEELAVAVDGWRSLRLVDLANRQREVVDLRVPLDVSDPDAGSLRTRDGRTAFVNVPLLSYDEATDTLVDARDGTEYTADQDVGFYASSDGQVLTPGWRVFSGLDNYRRVFTDTRLAGPLLQVTVWTFAFAAISVVSTFAVGVMLAATLDHPRMRGKRVYRSLLLLPYAAPSFMSMLLWAGFLNPSFGFVNQVLLGGADIQWLTDPWLARFSVLLVNLWLGFPYMLLVCTGALQSIPVELREAARVDGAGPLRVFRSITLPLLLVSVAPLLIASFAFNFNNFTLIYFITGGGPNIPEAAVSVGSTDLLIHVVYSLGFESGSGQQWGFACALSVLIFGVVATVSALGFRRTTTLENLS